jgi:hypothetical protein
MPACAAAVSIASPTLVALGAAFVFGLTASGWNGVFSPGGAPRAGAACPRHRRRSPPICNPAPALLMAGVAQVASIQRYAVLAALALLATVALRRAPP